MGKESVKVEISVSRPDELTKIGDDLLQKHIELGKDSPLIGLDMEKFAQNLSDGIAKRAEAKKLHEKAELLNQQAGISLGTDRSQNAKTPGTIYSTLTSARDILLGTYKGQERKLAEWGFDVVINDVPNGPKTKLP
ncbi:MAG TPA: hypothetical protein VFC67_13910 [Prolixibacteraceae bacterium]|nr:hypothetical protein [Prolixibacteraceae bacterium]